jgi:hypothetical protein
MQLAEGRAKRELIESNFAAKNTRPAHLKNAYFAALDFNPLYASERRDL